MSQYLRGAKPVVVKGGEGYSAPSPPFLYISAILKLSPYHPGPGTSCGPLHFLYNLSWGHAPFLTRDAILVGLCSPPCHMILIIFYTTGLVMSHLLFYLCSSFPFPPSHLSLAFLPPFSPLKDNHMWLLCVTCLVYASPIHTSHSVSCFAPNAISLKLGNTSLLDPDHSHTLIHPKLPSHTRPWWSHVVFVLLCCLYYAPILLSFCFK